MRLTGQHTDTKKSLTDLEQIYYMYGGDRVPKAVSLESWKEAQMVLMTKGRIASLQSRGNKVRGKQGLPEAPFKGLIP